MRTDDERARSSRNLGRSSVALLALPGFIWASFFLALADIAYPVLLSAFVLTPMLFLVAPVAVVISARGAVLAAMVARRRARKGTAIDRELRRALAMNLVAFALWAAVIAVLIVGTIEEGVWPLRAR